jgi:hypothetical protein
MDHFVALDDPSKSKSLLYVKPGGRLEKKMAGRRLYYVKQSKKDRRIAAENAALDNENAEDAEYAEGDEQEQEGLDEEAPVVSPGAAEDPQNAPEGAGEHVDYFDGADLSAYDALPKVNEHADDLETDEDEDEAGDGSINNLECVLCATDGMVEPLISECKHICCNECWMTWLDETKDTGGVCPECEKPVDADTLYPVSLCSMCQSPPTDPWKAPCGHEGCKECWTSWVANTQDGDPIVACPSCSKDFPRAILPI